MDPNIDQFANLLSELFSTTKGLTQEFKLSDILGMGDSAAKDRWIEMFKDLFKALFNFCIGNGKFAKGPSLFLDDNGKSRLTQFIDGAANACSTVGSIIKNNLDSTLPDGFLDAYIMEFPYILYYRLLSSTTLNIYELPYLGDDLYSTDGEKGWDGNVFLLNKFTGGDGMMGKVLNLVVKTGDLINRAKINYQPQWDAPDNGTPDEVTVKFNLFNDTDEAALKNFIFVNTIVPNNLWMQYGMFKHSPCVYDVKIEGLKRLFLCNGSFRVKNIGLLRTPPMSWIFDLCFKHANNSKKSFYICLEIKLLTENTDKLKAKNIPFKF